MVAPLSTSSQAAGDKAASGKPAAGGAALPVTPEEKEMVEWLQKAGLGAAAKGILAAGVHDLVDLANMTLTELRDLGLDTKLKNQLWERLQRLEVLSGRFY